LDLAFYLHKYGKLKCEVQKCHIYHCVWWCLNFWENYLSELRPLSKFVGNPVMVVKICCVCVTLFL